MQKNILFLAIAVLFLSFKTPVTVKIEISNLKNNKGKILLEFSDAEKNFIKGVSQEIVNNHCTISIDNLKPGKYTFKYFHDENNNNEMDTNWIGIPKEGFGFSNNAKGKFGPPSHEKMIFELIRDTTMICDPTYIIKK